MVIHNTTAYGAAYYIWADGKDLISILLSPSVKR